jgi:hypothetical protein
MRIEAVQVHVVRAEDGSSAMSQNARLVEKFIPAAGSDQSRIL